MGKWAVQRGISDQRQSSLRRVAGRPRGRSAVRGNWWRSQAAVSPRRNKRAAINAIGSKTTRRAAGRQRSNARSARISAKGANARSAGALASARTSAKGANARSAGARASASTSDKGADARSVGWGASNPRSSLRGRRAVDRQRNSDVSSCKRPCRHIDRHMCSQAHPLSFDITYIL